MNKSILLIMGVLIIILAAVFVGYASDQSYTAGDEKTFNVSSEGPFELSKFIEEVKTHEYYEGYDNDTVVWMETLGNKYVWFGDDAVVIMDKVDSDKIPSEFVLDAYFQEIFTANVLEKHPLGNVKYPRDVYLVNHVEFITQETHSFDV